MLQLVLSWGGVRTPDALAITAAGAALAVSDIPCAKPVAGARVGWPSTSPVPVVNPTVEQVRQHARSMRRCCAPLTHARFVTDAG